MQILSIPAASSNPYQFLLADELKKHKITVIHKQRLPNERWLLENRKKTRIVHVHWPEYLYSWGRKTPLGLIRYIEKLVLCKSLGYKIIWTVHNLSPHDRFLLNYNILGYIITYYLANAIIVHCAYAKAEIQRRFSKRKNIFIIQHGNYTRNYKSSISKRDARNILGIDENAFVFLSFGQIRRYKGLDQILQAFYKIMDNDHDSILVIAGENYSTIENLSNIQENNKRVLIHDAFIPDEQVPKYFAAADIFVASYNKILTSGSIMLALSLGLPVIAPYEGCLPELINSKTGILYARDDSNGLFNAMSNIKKKNIKFMRENAYQTARRFDWEQVGELTNEVYLKVCNG